jgi:oxygen-dependent protoporphyrinogen oxidase
MKHFAIIGGGIAGLAAAYELELARKRGSAIDWQLHEASGRLGGILETTCIDTPDGTFILEGGPDAWVTDKPWARELACELGLEDQIIACNEAAKKTYVLLDGVLQAMPPRMRMMVPEDLATLQGSALFTDSARTAYATELERAAELKASAPQEDESVASFVRRHFGEEVLAKIGAPLLSGVFGGDVETLSVRAVMPAFVAMEREHGSLIAALQAKAAERGERAPRPTFTSLRYGMGSLADALVATLPPERIHLHSPIRSLTQVRGHVLLAAPIDAARALLRPADADAAALIPTEASSAVLATFCWHAKEAREFSVPEGFGFLVPQNADDKEQLLACTFVDQKFEHRAPPGARVIRVFFGGTSAQAMHGYDDAAIASQALGQLVRTLGPMPAPDAALTRVRRWPRSLPQYPVGHLERLAELDRRVTALDGLTLLGNGYRGVGVPDLIRDARKAAQDLCAAS